MFFFNKHFISFIDFRTLPGCIMSPIRAFLHKPLLLLIQNSRTYQPLHLFYSTHSPIHIPILSNRTLFLSYSHPILSYSWHCLVKSYYFKDIRHPILNNVFHLSLILPHSLTEPFLIFYYVFCTPTSLYFVWFNCLIFNPSNYLIFYFYWLKIAIIFIVFPPSTFY